MVIRVTSLQAFMELKADGKDITDQEKVYLMISKFPNKTDGEIAMMLGFEDKNKVRPRRNELVEEGYVESNGKAHCGITGKLCYRWRVLK